MIMKVAAIQMKAIPGDVDKNLAAAKSLAGQAFAHGAGMVILPEFFTSAVGFAPVMKSAARPLDGPVTKMLAGLAKKHDGAIGGSFLAKKKGGCFNTFVMAFPDGSLYYHDKDQPTMWENCYYEGGSDDGVLETPLGKIGVALCWELVRTRTARRLLNRVDLVVGGSCWWDLPDKKLPGYTHAVREKNHAIMEETPSRFARLLGCPVIHAAHAGELSCKTPLLPWFPYTSRFLGQTQIVDGSGEVLTRMEQSDGDGFITAQLEWPGSRPPSESIPDRFWIPDIPLPIRFAWWYQNLHGKIYYRLHGSGRKARKEKTR